MWGPGIDLQGNPKNCKSSHFCLVVNAFPDPSLDIPVAQGWAQRAARETGLSWNAARINRSLYKLLLIRVDRARQGMCGISTGKMLTFYYYLFNNRKRTIHFFAKFKDLECSIKCCCYVTCSLMTPSAAFPGFSCWVREISSLCSFERCIKVMFSVLKQKCIWELVHKKTKQTNHSVSTWPRLSACCGKVKTPSVSAFVLVNYFLYNISNMVLAPTYTLAPGV